MGESEGQRWSVQQLNRPAPTFQILHRAAGPAFYTESCHSQLSLGCLKGILKHPPPRKIPFRVESFLPNCSLLPHGSKLSSTLKLSWILPCSSFLISKSFKKFANHYSKISLKSTHFSPSLLPFLWSHSS